MNLVEFEQKATKQKSIEDAALIEVFEVCAAEVQNQHQYKEWFIDSGATTLVTSNLDLLSHVKNALKSAMTTTSRNLLLITGKGSATIDANKAIDNVYYVLDTVKILLFVGNLSTLDITNSLALEIVEYF